MGPSKSSKFSKLGSKKHASPEQVADIAIVPSTLKAIDPSDAAAFRAALETLRDDERKLSSDLSILRGEFARDDYGDDIIYTQYFADYTLPTLATFVETESQLTKFIKKVTKRQAADSPAPTAIDIEAQRGKYNEFLDAHEEKKAKLSDLRKKLEAVNPHPTWNVYEYEADISYQLIGNQRPKTGYKRNKRLAESAAWKETHNLAFISKKSAEILSGKSGADEAEAASASSKKRHSRNRKRRAKVFDDSDSSSSSSLSMEPSISRSKRVKITNSTSAEASSSKPSPKKMQSTTPGTLESAKLNAKSSSAKADPKGKGKAADTHIDSSSSSDESIRNLNVPKVNRNPFANIFLNQGAQKSGMTSLAVQEEEMITKRIRAKQNQLNDVTLDTDQMTETLDTMKATCASLTTETKRLGEDKQRLEDDIEELLKRKSELESAIAEKPGAEKPGADTTTVQNAEVPKAEI
ncbi:hypothetical protein G7Y89_g14897 [Cudoniella acicularis]|uniref:Uncharacterized protein n=1 Tax=Cudoniella acicularis TaxID=354080 RepID=A0A8H4VSH4_9HELO|nr:hypothetical protein G7Y89_g14897 [Cudoniella acicularis]